MLAALIVLSLFDKVIIGLFLTITLAMILLFFLAVLVCWRVAKVLQDLEGNNMHTFWL